jgi:L-rhamnose-H+ transport protein
LADLLPEVFMPFNKVKKWSWESYWIVGGLFSWLIVPPIAKNILFSALAGTTWFLQFFFYGMGESKMGNGVSSWILHMSTIILTANMWGIYRKEWSGVSRKTKTTITVGIAVIIASVFLMGIENSM